MARSARSLRALYLFRVAFSVVWVTLVFSLALPRASAGSSSVLAGILLVIYPVSDSVATVFDLRVNSAWKVWHYANLAAGIAATIGILGTVFSDLATAICVFGGWAIASGGIQLALAVRRRKILGGQGLMIISGAGSVFAGITFIRWTGTPGTGLAALAQYSAGGAIWYLLAVFWLFRSARGPAPAG